jgi:hypothetical protein
MKVRLDFSKNPKQKPVFIAMESLPRVGEWLVSGTYGTCEVLKVLHTPDESTQDVVLVLGQAED